MLLLHGRAKLHFDADPFVGRVTTDSNRPPVVRQSEVLVSHSGPVLLHQGFKCHFVQVPSPTGPVLAEEPILDLPPELVHLEEGDVVHCDPRQGKIVVTYKRRSKSNGLLLTETCNNACIMCCQPPKAAHDDALIAIALDTIRLMDRATCRLAITGGEPTLKWQGLLDIVRTAKGYLPNTGVQILSNGRAFKYLSKAQEFASLRHPNLIVGVPIHSAVPEIHNHIAQRREAFDETVLGLMNLKRCGIAVQLRVVIQQANVDSLTEMGQFIARNLAFADHVAFMGLEVHGLALDNQRSVWIDPVDYAEELGRAVLLVAAHGMNVSIFNVPLCVLPQEAWRFSEQSISDWKMEYGRTECEWCMERYRCCGLFGTSGDFQSRGIHNLARSAPTGF